MNNTNRRQFEARVRALTPAFRRAFGSRFCRALLENAVREEMIESNYPKGHEGMDPLLARYISLWTMEQKESRPQNKAEEFNCKNPLWDWESMDNPKLALRNKIKNGTWTNLVTAPPPNEKLEEFEFERKLDNWFEVIWSRAAADMK